MTEQQERDITLKMIKDKKTWTQYELTTGQQCLYLKKRKPDGGFPFLGVVLEDSPNVVRQFKTDKFTKDGETTPIEYKDAGAIVLDGWVVD